MYVFSNENALVWTGPKNLHARFYPGGGGVLPITSYSCLLNANGDVPLDGVAFSQLD